MAGRRPLSGNASRRTKIVREVEGEDTLETTVGDLGEAVMSFTLSRRGATVAVLRLKGWLADQKEIARLAAELDALTEKGLVRLVVDCQNCRGLTSEAVHVFAKRFYPDRIRFFGLKRRVITWSESVSHYDSEEDALEGFEDN